MAIVNIIAFILVVIGSINWGLIGIFGWNLVSAICGEKKNLFNTLIYILVFLSSVWLIISAIIGGGCIALM